MLTDSQTEQRETMRLVYGSELRNRRGYQVEGALFCSHDPNPIPGMFSQDIWRKFRTGPNASQATNDFISEFRNRPIAYFVESYRLNQFPAAVRTFLSEHYVWYARSLFIAGFELTMQRTGAKEVDVIVAGDYRWIPNPETSGARIRVDATTVGPLKEITLAVGTHAVAADGQLASGFLMLAELPAPVRDAYPAFYHSRQISQLGGRR
jgi:hypothetical protein